MSQLNIQYCSHNIQTPREGDAGFDLYSAEEVVIPASTQAVIPTGVKVAIPKGYVGIIKDRSSMAIKSIYTHAGVIDSNYRGEIKVVISNAGTTDFTITKGMKFSQMIVIPCITSAVAVSLEELGTTNRGENGFGSTGQ